MATVRLKKCLLHSTEPIRASTRNNRNMLITFLASYGFVDCLTNEGNVCFDPSNVLFARLGTHVSHERVIQADGDAFWWYDTNGNDPNYGVVQGAPELAVFRQHSLNMQAKNVASGTPIPTPTITVTPTPAVTPTPTTTPTSTPTPVPTPTSTPTPTPTVTPGSSCSVHYAATVQSSTAFGASFTITNTGTTAINAWSLQFSFTNGQTITQLWNGNFTQSGGNVTVTNLSYNGSIAPGTSLSNEPGFNGTWSGINSAPTAFKLNGVSCSIV